MMKMKFSIDKSYQTISCHEKKEISRQTKQVYKDSDKF